MENDLRKLFNEFEDVMQYSTRLSPETLRGYRAVFNLFLKIMPEISTLKFLSTEMLIEFFKRIQTRTRIVGKNKIKKGVKNSTIKTQWSKLNVFFNWLEKKGCISVNPLNDIRPPSVKYDDFRKIEDSDIQKIYSAIVLKSSNSFIRRRDTMMVSLLLFLGIRKGEFISLRVSDFNKDRAVMTIRGETSKSKITRKLKIHPTLLLHIQEYFEAREALGLRTECLIASNKGDKGLSRQGLKHWTNALIKKSGVKLHLHMFRHTFACKLDENNVSAFKIQKLLGHTSILMTMKYIRSMRTESMGEDIDKLSFG